MTLGEKIKNARKAGRITQSALAGSKITRNMLSAIENDKATPSLDTLKYIAEVLDLPLPYLLSEENDLAFYRKRERMGAIKNALETGNYNTCISLITKLDTLDDELFYILAKCYFELGVYSAKNGALATAETQLLLCRDYSMRTLYDTVRFECAIPLYLAVARNVGSPLLEFDEKEFSKLLADTVEYEFYKYLTLDFDFKFTNFQYKTHMAAKALIKERHYSDALKLLLEIEETKSDFEYNSYLMYGVYGDLDLCYKQLFDFENAYRFAAKRLSLMEGFNV